MSFIGGKRAVLTACAGVLLSLWAQGAVPVAADKPELWLNWVIPLPKESAIKQQVTVPAGEVKLTLRAGAGELEQNAFRKLQNLFFDKAGVPGTASGGQQFEILLGVCDAQGRLGNVTVPDGARLQTLPNREQAYLIRPLGANRLALTALDARGVFYAAETLRQLLEPRFKGDSVTLPLAAITDWPDLSERGLWGGSATRDIEWMAERKMNVIDFHSPHEVLTNGQATASVDQDLIRRGRLNAVNMIPIIQHLNHMGSRGVYDAYPDLRGKGKDAELKTECGILHTPCGSNPKLREILADWFRGYAANRGATDICCWLSELEKHRCGCETCAKTGHHALETRACVEALRMAREQYPDLRIRILLTQGSYDHNDTVLAEIPPDVQVTYYEGLRTYDISTNTMIYPLLETYAASGRWLGVYPTLFPHWRYVTPWSCPQFIKFRMTEYVDKKLKNMTGYIAPDNRLFDFNVTAAAEWGWNAHGRTEQEFSLAWATRQGFKQPRAVADWAVKLGAVSWDLYEPRFVARYMVYPGAIKGMIAKRAKPSFGEGMFAQIPDEARLRANRAVCGEALRLAEETGTAAMLSETLVTLSYYDLLIGLCDICNVLSVKGPVGMAERRTLQDIMNGLVLTGSENIEAYRDWERTAGPGAGGGGVDESVRATVSTIQAVADALKPFGVRNPSGIAMSSRIGVWKTEDFKDNPILVKEFDVTGSLVLPGPFSVTFKHTSSALGTYISRAALVASPKDKPGERIELCVDEHNSSVPNPRDGKNTYHLRLDTIDPNYTYYLVAKLRNPCLPNFVRNNCNGDVLFQCGRKPDWQARVMSVTPLSETPGK